MVLLPKPGLDIRSKDRKHRLENMFLQAVQLWLGLHVAVMIVNIYLSQEIFAIDMLRALRLLFVLATEHTLLRIFKNIWRQILLPGDLHDATF